MDDAAQQRLAYGQLIQGLSAEEASRELSAFRQMVGIMAPEGVDTARELSIPTVAAVEFDFDQPPPAPDYVVDKLLERCTVNMFSGDTGAGKSIFTTSLVVAAARASMTDSGWLGREVLGTRSIVIDEENPERLVRARMAAMGMTNDLRDLVRYYDRRGILVGEESWNAWLRAEIQDHRADFVMIDTAMAATFVDVNDNNEVVELYRGLRTIAEDTGCCILILHHERKSQAGTPSAPAGHGMMGARQWAGQADTHVEIKTYGDLIETEAQGNRRRMEREFVMNFPKIRGGEPNIHYRVAIVSEKDADSNRLLSMDVENRGPLDYAADTHSLAAKIMQVLESEGTAGTTTLAMLVDRQPADMQFKAALNLAKEKGTIHHNRNNGTYTYVGTDAEALSGTI